jgi:type IV secretory pathway VirB3-like protein
MENNENGAKTDARNALKNRGVFTRKKEHFGIPAQMFFAGIALSVGIAVTVAWWGGLLLALIFFPTMYHIHKEDPAATEVWLRGLKRKNTHWVPGWPEKVETKFFHSRTRQRVTQHKQEF